MKIIDLTHTISEKMPVYPGTERPKLTIANTYEKDFFKETLMTMYSHTGTHMDPPAHIFAGKMTLDRFPITQFIGSAAVIDCSDLGENGRITMEQINKNRENADKAEFIVFRTDWDKYWGRPEYYVGYPFIDDEVAEYIITNRKKGIGLDNISLDPVGSLNYHKKVFKENEIVIIENLTNLKEIGADLFTLFALPLKYENADGSPIRAVAVLE